MTAETRSPDSVNQTKKSEENAKKSEMSTEKKLEDENAETNQKTSPNTIVTIGTRKSKLALWQTHWVLERLKKQLPDVEFRLIEEATLGDNVLDRHLADLGRDAPGLFTKVF